MIRAREPVVVDQHELPLAGERIGQHREQPGERLTEVAEAEQRGRRGQFGDRRPLGPVVVPCRSRLPQRDAERPLRRGRMPAQAAEALGERHRGCKHRGDRARGGGCRRGLSSGHQPGHPLTRERPDGCRGGARLVSEGDRRRVADCFGRDRGAVAHERLGECQAMRDRHGAGRIGGEHDADAAVHRSPAGVRGGQERRLPGGIGARVGARKDLQAIRREQRLRRREAVRVARVDEQLHDAVDVVGVHGPVHLVHHQVSRIRCAASSPKWLCQLRSPVYRCTPASRGRGARAAKWGRMIPTWPRRATIGLAASTRL